VSQLPLDTSGPHRATLPPAQRGLGLRLEAGGTNALASLGALYELLAPGLRFLHQGVKLSVAVECGAGQVIQGLVAQGLNALGGALGLFLVNASLCGCGPRSGWPTVVNRPAPDTSIGAEN
jgi:hypothetical protein